MVKSKKGILILLHNRKTVYATYFKSKQKWFLFSKTTIT